MSTNEPTFPKSSSVKRYVLMAFIGFIPLLILEIQLLPKQFSELRFISAELTGLEEIRRVGNVGEERITLNRQTIRKISQLANQYSITLDPNLETYHLGRLVTDFLPKLLSDPNPVAGTTSAISSISSDMEETTSTLKRVLPTLEPLLEAAVSEGKLERSEGSRKQLSLYWLRFTTELESLLQRNKQNIKGHIWLNILSTFLIYLLVAFIFRYRSSKLMNHLSQLEEQLEDLLLAQDISKVGSWSFHFKTGRRHWSPQQYTIAELDSSIPPEHLLQKYFEQTHPEDREDLVRLVERAKANAEDFHTIHRIRQADGAGIKHILAMGRAQRDSKNQPLKIAGTCQDITEDIRLRERHQFILKSLGIRLWTMDPVSKSITWISDWDWKRTTVPLKEEQAWLSLTPASLRQFLDAIKIAAESSSVFDVTVETLDKSPGQYMSIRGVIEKNERGEILLIQGLAQDISQKLVLRQRVESEKAKSLQNAKLASLGEMAAGIAHEVNNPLAIIMSSLPLLEKLKDSPKFSEKLSMVEKAGDRMSKIIQGLKKFSRSAGSSDKSHHNLSQIVQEALSLAEFKANRSNVQISAELSSNAIIHCSSTEIEQVIVNLVHNSIDSVRTNPDRWVKVKTTDLQSGLVLLQVIDSGHGISTELESQLFQPFFTTKPVGEGTGLGLSISKTIIEDHGGRIEINHDSPHTCFDVTLPQVTTTHQKGGTYDAA